MRKITVFLLLVLIAQSTWAQSNANVLKEYKIALILPFNSKKARTKLSEVMLDYYAGFKIGVQAAAADGFKCRLYVFDNSKDSGQIGTILKHPDMGKMDLIIGPVYDKDVDYVNAFCDSTHQIYINPLRYYSKDDIKHFIINFFPNDEMQVTGVVDKLSIKYHKNYVYYVLTDKSASSASLAKSAHAALKAKGLTVGNDLSFENNAVVGKIWKSDSVIIINTIKSKESIDAIEKTLATHVHSYGIAHFDYQKNNKKYLKYDKILFPDLYYYNGRDSTTARFNSKFRMQQAGNSSKYGGIGYDQANYLAYSLMVYGTDFVKFLPNATYTGIRNSIQLNNEGNKTITNTATYFYKQSKGFKTKIF